MGSDIWRVGRHLGRTIYKQVGDEPSDADVFLGIMDTIGLAALVVDEHNESRDVKLTKLARDTLYGKKVD